MIPYFQFISFKIGFLTIYVWGTFVVAGILTGFFLLYRQGFLDSDANKKNFNLVFYLMIASIVGGRLGYVLFYDFSYFLTHPLSIIRIWDGGMSSLGGFLAVAFVLLVALPKGQKLKYLDILAIPFIVTWAIARIGCFMIHDHLGRLSDFFLTVQFPFGARHDMAFYEILAMAIFLVGYQISLRLTAARSEDQVGKSSVAKSRKLPDGFLTAATILYYSVVRFFLDFLRAIDLSNSDPRYLGLTPAQYGMILFFMIGLAILFKYVKLRRKDF